MAESTEAADREHVTRFVVRQPERFRHASVSSSRSDDLSFHRWTLDTREDYRLLSRLFAELGTRADEASTEDVLRIFAAHPELRAMNQDVVQKPSN
jgi:spore coat polysaccharide biosynthesis protein SpsF